MNFRAYQYLIDEIARAIYFSQDGARVTTDDAELEFNRHRSAYRSMAIAAMTRIEDLVGVTEDLRPGIVVDPEPGR